MKTLPPILFIEDNTDDVFFFKRLLLKSGVQNPIVTFEDGEGAVSYLSEIASEKKDGVLPFIIFTDLRMSVIGGLEFCRWLRGHPVLERLTTFVLSGSEFEKDVQCSRDVGTNGYLVKFPTSDEFAAILRDAGGTFTDVPDSIALPIRDKESADLQ